MDLSTSIQAYVRATGSKDTGLGTGRDEAEISENVELTDGTGATQADQSYHVNDSALAAAAVDTHDFNGGGLTDGFGDTIALARTKVLWVKNTSSTAATITVAGTNGIVGSGFSLRKGQFALLVCGAITAGDATGYPVAAGSSDTITVTNDSGSLAATYDMLVVGATA